MKETLVTRGYVREGEGAAYTLDYYIEDRERADYAVKIKVSHDGELVGEAEQPLGCSRSLAEDTVHLLARNFVFPIHLKQIIADMKPSVGG